MSTRYFSFWCERCPTRVVVETDNPTYIGAHLGVASIRVDVGDEPIVAASTRCPACGSQLYNLEDLVSFREVPIHDKTDTAKEHAAWRERQKEEGDGE